MGCGVRAETRYGHYAAAIDRHRVVPDAHRSAGRRLGLDRRRGRRVEGGLDIPVAVIEREAAGHREAAVALVRTHELARRWIEGARPLAGVRPRAGNGK